MSNVADRHQDQWIRQLVRNDGTQGTPSDATDQKILAAALAATQAPRRSSPLWVWPVALAASVTVCAGIFLAMTKIMPKGPVVVVMEPSRQEAERPPQAIGDQAAPEAATSASSHDESIDHATRGVLVGAHDDDSAVDDLSVETLQRHMDQALAAGEVAAFADLVRIWERRFPFQPLPERFHSAARSLQTASDATTLD